MQLTDRQTNAAIQAIVLKYAPNFHELSPEEKTSLGKSTFWWFHPIVSALPDSFEPSRLGEDYWELIKTVAANFLVGVIRHANPQHSSLTDDELKDHIRLTDLETQAILFLNLAQTGLAAAHANGELATLADSLADLDLDMELRKLIAAEG